MCTISPPIHAYVSVCLSVYLSSVCMLVCTVSCQSITLVSHTTCLSFVNVYVGTCPPICHIHVHYFPPLHVCRSVTPCPAHVFLYFLYLYASTPAYPSHSYAQCLPYVFVCLCFCVHMSVYHVHSYVSMCLSATFMYTIRPFRTFLRLSVDLRVFVYVYFHVNILHVQLFVRLFVTFVRHPPNTCLCV